MRLALLALLLSATAAASAEPGISSRAMTCAKVQAAIEQNGAALVTYAPSGFDRSNALSAVLTLGDSGFDRVAHDARFCLPRQALTPIWVPTRDNAKCFAGYTCSEADGYGGRHSR